MDINQVKQDFDSGTLICRETIGKVIELAMKAPEQGSEGHSKHYFDTDRNKPLERPAGAHSQPAAPVAIMRDGPEGAWAELTEAGESIPEGSLCYATPVAPASSIGDDKQFRDLCREYSRALRNNDERKISGAWFAIIAYLDGLLEAARMSPVVAPAKPSERELAIREIELKKMADECADAIRALKSGASAPPSPQPVADSVPGWERGIATVSMNGHQLMEALEFIAPDRDAEPDQMDNDLTFGIVQHKDDDGQALTGLCCWNDDTDGVLPLDGEPATSAAAALQPVGVGLTDADVEWVTNDNAELGVKIGNQFFFLYKGQSIVYESGAHDNGEPMQWRHVFKREFGECCNPINYSDPTKGGTVSLSDSDEWKPLLATPKPDASAEQPAGEVETVAWLVEWETATGQKRRTVGLHNLAGDILAGHGNAKITELIPRLAAPISEDTAKDAMRQALEIIAVGDASNPSTCAEEALIATGFWQAKDISEDTSKGAAAERSQSSESELLMNDPAYRAQFQAPPGRSGTTADREFAEGVVYACARVIEMFDQPTIAENVLRESGVDVALGCPEDLEFLRKIESYSEIVPAPADAQGSGTTADERTYGTCCTCPSGDGSLRWPCPEHPPIPAPADSSSTLEAEWNQLMTALNCDDTQSALIKIAKISQADSSSAAPSDAYAAITLGNLKAGKLTAARVYVAYCELRGELDAANGAIERYKALAAPSPTADSSAAPSAGSAAAAWKDLVDQCIAVLRRHIVPDGISDHDALSELYGILDGPAYRNVADIAQEQCGDRQREEMSIDKCAVLATARQPEDKGLSAADAYEVRVRHENGALSNWQKYDGDGDAKQYAIDRKGEWRLAPPSVQGGVVNDARLDWLYNSNMKPFIAPIMSKAQWLAAIDKQIVASPAPQGAAE